MDLLELLSLPVLQLLVGIGVKIFFHGQVAGSEQKYAPLPCFLCMEHPNHSPGGRSGCLFPLEADEFEEGCDPDWLWLWL